MGWFDGASEVAFGDGRSSPSRSSHHGGHGHQHKKHRKSKTTTGSTFGDWAAGIGGGGKHEKHAKSTTGSTFGDWAAGVNGGGARHGNKSTASFFSVGSSRGSSTSSYRRSPRRGYLAKMYSQLRHLLRRLIRYLKSHPLKVFMLVLMPLITGGALTTLLGRFGLRLPAGLGSLASKFGGSKGGFGSAAAVLGGLGTGVGRSRDGEYQFERKRVSGPLESFGGMSGVMDGLGGVMSMAKLFI